MRIVILLICSSMALASCASAPVQKPKPTATSATSAALAPASAASTLPAHDKLDATLWMQSAIEYRALMQGLFHAAQEQLPAALADPGWQALAQGEAQTDSGKLPTAVIVDIDETMLDNSPYLARQIMAGSYGFDSQGWATWVAEKAARALPGAKEFAEFAAAHGITMIYISNRDLKDLAATSENLASQGFPLVDDSVLLLGAATPDCIAKGSDKGCRRRLIAQRYRVVMLIGDNLGDFIDGVGTDVTAREALLAPYQAWLGRRWFMLPNPSYGSWESALTKFPIDPSLKTDARAAKRAALRLK
ncbi:MAG: HAD family acid phosphatase [Tahibacter sp.]